MEKPYNKKIHLESKYWPKRIFKCNLDSNSFFSFPFRFYGGGWGEVVRIKFLLIVRAAKCRQSNTTTKWQKSIRIVISLPRVLVHHMENLYMKKTLQK